MSVVLNQLLPMIKPSNQRTNDDYSPEELLVLLIYIYSVSGEFSVDKDLGEGEEKVKNALAQVFCEESELSPLLQKITGECLTKIEDINITDTKNRFKNKGIWKQDVTIFIGVVPNFMRPDECQPAFRIRGFCCRFFFLFQLWQGNGLLVACQYSYSQSLSLVKIAEYSQGVISLRKNKMMCIHPIQRISVDIFSLRLSFQT